MSAGDMSSTLVRTLAGWQKLLAQVSQHSRSVFCQPASVLTSVELMSPADIHAKIPSELELLPGRPPLSSRHILAMAVASIAVHVIIAAFFLSLPEVIPPPRSSVITSDFHRVIHFGIAKALRADSKGTQFDQSSASRIGRPQRD